MARKKNLTKEEIELEFENWEKEQLTSQSPLNVLKNKIEIKCRSKAQKEAVDTIENNYISIITGPPGCLIGTEKIRIYALSPKKKL